MDGELVLDAGQRNAAACLAAVIPRLGRRWRRPRGVYLYGRPGRGKTMLMDRFFAEVRSNRKRRFHFHGFFARLHSAVAELGTIGRAVDAVLGDAELVCFDEFHVHDIGDAMLIARLLDALFARGVVLVVTSNYAPDELLPNPLFHERFLPTIERIHAHLDVLVLDGPRDYRESGARRTGFASGRYLVDAESSDVAFSEGAPHRAVLPADLAASSPGDVSVRIAHRQIRARVAGNNCLAANFDELCGTPLSAADYLELTTRYHHWTLHNVPILRTVPTDHVTRFVNLVDILYDADSPLTVHAAAPLPDLVRDVARVPDLARTASRLGELPSAARLVF
ncbi:cell division protein ZapE [Nocardia blacklockiae]|uniref:cell division protein ZapE n=1 Tax=Nocardia blacklockiae TaxID=480036 RepID=UPI002B4ABE5F|nr:cell division protein ZapE [Nocardia blacklockiae]